MARTLLVTGASGFLGGHVARVATAAGFEVHGTWWTTRPEALEGRPHHVDLRSFQELGALLMHLRPDAIVHTAYRQDDEEPWPLNLAAAVRLAGAAQGLGARLVALSTDLVFDGALGRPYREDDPVAPLDGYGAGKARAEELVLERCPSAAVVRTSLLLDGEGGSKHEQLALAAARGEQDVTFFTDETRSPVLVQDVAAACVALLDHDHAGLLHVAGPEELNRLEVAQRICERAGVGASGLRGGDGPPSRPKRCALDSSLAQTVLGHTAAIV